MVHLEKKLDTLVKSVGSEGSSFLDVPRTLTFTIIDDEGHTGYFSNNPEDVSLELDENIIFFKVKDTTIDGTLFTDAQSFINYVYDL
jgi:hypothetical protein